MYDTTQIKSLISHIGWNQNSDPQGWQLTDMTNPIGGRFVNSLHPALTFQNISDAAKEFHVIHSDNSARDTAFTNWLKSNCEEWICSAVDDWFDYQDEELIAAKSLLENKKEFHSTVNTIDLDPDNNNLVGRRFQVRRSDTISATIKSVSLNFSSDEDIVLYLFKSGRSTPLQQSAEINYSSGTEQEVELNWTLKGEGSYYICYFQSELSGRSINGIPDENFGVSFDTGKYLNSKSFSVNHSSAVMWNIDDNIYTTGTNYGLNFSVSVQCDYTKLITDNASAFRKLFLLKCAIEMVRLIAFNPNTRKTANTSNHRLSKDDLLADIEGDTQGRNNHTLNGKYQKALKSLKVDLSSIDKVCIPCQENGIRTSSIGLR